MDSYGSREESKPLRTSLKTSDKPLRPNPTEPRAIDPKKEHGFTNENLESNRTLDPRTCSTDTGKFKSPKGLTSGDLAKMYCLKCGSQLNSNLRKRMLNIT